MNTGTFKRVRTKLFVLAVTALMATMALAQTAFACSAPTGGC